MRRHDEILASALLAAARGDTAGIQQALNEQRALVVAEAEQRWAALPEDEKRARREADYAQRRATNRYARR